MAGVLADRGQAVLDGAVQVSADSRRRATCTGVDGVSTGLLGGVLLADPACPGGSQQPGA